MIANVPLGVVTGLGQTKFLFGDDLALRPRYDRYRARIWVDVLKGNPQCVGETMWRGVHRPTVDVHSRGLARIKYNRLMHVVMLSAIKLFQRFRECLGGQQVTKCGG